MPKTTEQRTTEQRVYLGVRTSDGPGDTAVYVEQGGCRWPLRHVVHHSPSGLRWGYGGSGPADTALSILADALGERPTREQLYRGEPWSWRWHQAFKWAIVATFPLREGWRLPLATVEAWIARRRAQEVPMGEA
ncbi:MAG: hypothetical protein M3Q65_13960 [Chloroflexota bacterium]|nr:hypothetical protein [Chloroflexota bacterium]